MKDDPDLLLEVHKKFLFGGADIITTCSYQATFEGFKKKGFSYELSVKLFERSVSIAKDAVR